MSDGSPLRETSSSWALFSTAMNVLGRAATLVAWLFLTPFILRHLGGHDFGVWILVGAIAGYVRLVEFGVGSAVTRELRREIGAGDLDAASVTVASATRAYLRLGAMALPFAVVAGPLAAHVWGHQLLYLVPLAGVSVVLGLPSLVPIAALAGLGRFELANGVAIFGMALYAAAIVLVLSSGLGLPALVLAEGVASALTTIPAMLLLRRAAPALVLSPRLADPDVARRLLRFGRPLFGVTLSSQIQEQSDELLIGLLGNAAQVTPYALSRRIAEVPRIAATSFSRIVLPVASGLADDPSRMREVLVATVRVTFAITLATTCPLLPLARPFLVAWAGPQYTSDVIVSWLLLSATAIEMLAWPAGSILQAISKHGILAREAVLAAGINIGLSAILFRPYGVAGVATATIVSSIVGTAIVLVFTARAIDLPASRFIAHALAPPVIAGAPSLLASWLLTRAIGPSTLIEVALVATAAGLVYLGAYLALPAATVERDLVATMARRLRRR